MFHILKREAFLLTRRKGYEILDINTLRSPDALKQWRCLHHCCTLSSTQRFNTRERSKLLSSLFWNKKFLHETKLKLSYDGKIIPERIEDEEKFLIDDEDSDAILSENEFSDLKESEDLSDESKQLHSFLSTKIDDTHDATLLLELFGHHLYSFNKENIFKLVRALTSTLLEQDISPKSLDQKLVSKLWSRVSSFLPLFDKEQLITLLKSILLLKFENGKVLENLLKTLRYHVDKMSLKNIMFIDNLISDQKGSEAQNISSILPFAAEHIISTYGVEDCHQNDLRYILMYCVKKKLKGTGIVIRAINSSQDEFGDSVNIQSYLWSICTLPKFHTRKFMIEIDNIIDVEILAKRCLSYMAENIQDYSVKELCATLSRISFAYRYSNSNYVYHEKFLEAISSRAIMDGWEFNELNMMCKNQLTMNYINEVLVNHTVDILMNGYSNQKYFFHLITAISCLKSPNLNISEFIENHDYFNGIEKNTSLPYYAKVVELLNVNFIPRNIMKHFFNEYLFENFPYKKIMNYRIYNLKNQAFSMVQLRLKQLQDPSFEYISQKASQNLKNAIRYQAKKSRTSELENHLKELLENDFDKVVPNVVYKDSVIIDYLLVLDERGSPISVKPPSLRSDSTLYEFLDIPLGSKEICFQWASPGLVFRPQNYLHGSLQLMQRIMQEDGLNVIFSLHSVNSKERMFALKNDYYKASCT